jgi:hypothetical protein
MFNINHNDAITLEHTIRNLYGCDRAGIAGLANADVFEHYPMYAGVLAVAYFYAKRIPVDDNELDLFLNKYQVIFDYPDENDAAGAVKNYIADLKKVIEDYKR